MPTISGDNPEESISKSEKLELRVWPLLKDSYIEIKSLGILTKNYPTDEIPTRVISYTDEKSNLSSIQRQAFNELCIRKENFINRMKEKRSNSNFMYLMQTIMFTGFGAMTPTFFTSDRSITIPASILMSTGVCAGSTYLWLKGRREFKNKIKIINENVKKFETTPIDKFEIVQDEELADIADAIKHNQPLKITEPKNQQDYYSIEGMMKRIGNYISPFPTEVYEQKLSTYEIKH